MHIYNRSINHLDLAVAHSKERFLTYGFQITIIGIQKGSFGGGRKTRESGEKFQNKVH